MHLRANISPSRTRRRGFQRQGAFTLVEVLVAVCLLGLVAGGALWALTQANNYASVSRLYTGAENAAQNQIDLLLSDGPFNPQLGQVPVELKLSNPATSPGMTENNIVIYSEPGAEGRDPVQVLGKRETYVRDTGLTKNGVSLNIYSATVVVTYQFRNKTYSVQLNVMRASDV